MVIETKFNLDDFVYFINNDYKLDCAQITAIKFYKKNDYGLNKDYDNMWFEPYSPVTYTIKGMYERNENYIFKTKEELINSL